MRQHNTCVHFTGIQHKTCKEGVCYLDVRDASKPGPYKWPCLTLNGEPATTTCTKKRLPTHEELAADEYEFRRTMDAIDSGKSPCCGAALDESRVVDGTGPRFCSACKAFVFRGCASVEGEP